MPKFADVMLESKAVPCVFCQQSIFKSIGTVHGYNVTRCQNCKLVMLNPQPTPDSLARFYDQAYYSSDAAHIASLEMKQVMTQSQGKLETFHFVARQLQALVNGGNRLLDVGCAFGQFLAVAREYGFDVNGVEYSLPVARQARHFGFEVVGGDFLETIINPEAFDVITAWYVLEHVYEPVRFLSHMYKSLAPGGIAYIRVPNISFGLPFLWLHRVIRSPLPTIFSHIPAHLFFFDCTSIKTLLLDAGFSSVLFLSGLPVYSFESNLITRLSNNVRAAYAAATTHLEQISSGRVNLSPYISIIAKK